ncbi:ASCH domain-containing protein [Nostoc sp. GT001]|uniref:ASCH domain-containing protein n=1 Tax=Nostoc sp. GT001 TaxID=3056647 RepID=UPI0025AA5440|nr:ASCH domain-containing protein [Nostoc sp. GT001]MDM9583073.1 ASCH domain-containing protein [Nostoc sp. GT001]
MKAISLWQPWASFIPLGMKRYETRSWETNYRGDLLICSAKKQSREQERIYDKILYKYQDRYPDLLIDDEWCREWDDLPRGYAIAVVTLSDCFHLTEEFIAQQSEVEIDCGDWRVGRWAWKLEDIEKIVEPFPVCGKQGFFEVEFDPSCLDLEAVA